MTETLDDSWTDRLEHARSGNEVELGRLLERYRNYLTILARIQLHKGIQSKVSESDIVQQTFFRACQKFSSFRGMTQEELTGWLRRILASIMSSQVRHYLDTAARNTELEERILAGFDRSADRLNPTLLSREKSPASAFVRQEQSIRLADVIEMLPPDYREVIIGRFFEELSFAEIAMRMERTEDSVQKLWWRALARLRFHLKSED
jgi:RNA polymerase sigma-70 factor (ECF subfamily)